MGLNARLFEAKGFATSNTISDTLLILNSILFYKPSCWPLLHYLLKLIENIFLHPPRQNVEKCSNLVVISRKLSFFKRFDILMFKNKIGSLVCIRCL